MSRPENSSQKALSPARTIPLLIGLALVVADGASAVFAYSLVEPLTSLFGFPYNNSEMSQTGTTPPTPGPDAIVGNLFGLAQFGSSGTQVGLAMGTEVCNAGSVDIDWFALPNNDHPAVPQNLYRLSGGASNDERFEQIGQSNVTHAFVALAQNSCGFGCNGVSGDHLGVGCSNPDSPAFNAGPNLGSRAWINPFSGAFPGSNPGPNDHSAHTHNNVSHRLLVEANDLNTSLNQGASYYAEAQYVVPHEGSWCQSHPAECNQYNNVSYRRFVVNGTTSFNFSPMGSTVQTQLAIYAWPGATRVQIEPDPGNDGIGVVGYKVTNPSPGVWHYEYAIYNENIDRAIQSFNIPVGANVSLSNIGFHAPPQHPGWTADGTIGNAGFSSVPWSNTQPTGAVAFHCETFAQNPNANAIRWGTMYNFRFDSDQPPQNVTATLGFFKTGSPISVSVQGPAAGSTATATSTPTSTPTATSTPTNTPTPKPCTVVVTTVADSGPGSLRTALACASDGDTIDATTVSGTILLTTGELVVDKSVTILGPGPSDLAVNGNHADRVFHITPNRIVTISGLTIINGLVMGDNDQESGGGVYNDHSTLTLHNCVLSGNSAIAVGEESDVYGGGILNNGSGFAGQTGQATLMIVATTVSGNSAVHDPTATSDAWGGGVANLGSLGNATLMVIDSTLSGNSATYGGAIANFGSGGAASLRIINSTVTSNAAAGDGGGIYNNGTFTGTAMLTVGNSTLSSNSVGGDGGCIANVGFSGSGTVTLNDSILKDDGSSGNVFNNNGTVTSGGHNLSSDNAAGFLTAKGDQIDTDPLLGPLQENGGHTKTHALLPSSPAIDTGDPSFTPPPDNDQRGPGFPRIANGRIDKGSFEMQPVTTPTATNTPTTTPTEPPPPPIFANHTPICTTLGSGAALYPSVITVLGQWTHISRPKVILFRVNHQVPDNLDFLLVGPHGQKFLLMADAGGVMPIGQPGVDLTLSDLADRVLPDDLAPTDGLFEPTSWEPGQASFPTPAPPAPYNEPGSVLGGNGTQTLAATFGGLNPNGVWSLYVRDDGGSFGTGTTGCIDGGWQLQFLPAITASISGRVTTANGHGIRNSKIVATGGSLSEPLVATTGSFGYFSFDGLATGEIYVVSVNSQRYTFSTPSQVITLVDNVVDADFIADP